MTDREQQGQPRPDPKVAPETLELRARPQPVSPRFLQWLPGASSFSIVKCPVGSISVAGLAAAYR